MKRIVIVGATSGIGLEVARLSIRAGWRVGAAGRRTEALEALRAEAPAQVEIQSMDDSFFDRFNENDFKKITQNAKDNAYKTVNQDRLRNEGRKQLLENLNNIFVLAKALNYKIEDQTGQIDTSKL